MSDPKQITFVELVDAINAIKAVLSSPIILFVNGQVTVINADEIYDPFPEKQKDEDEKHVV